MKKEINLLRIIAATVGVIAGVAILVTFAMNYGKITGKDKETTAPLTTAAETIAEATSEPNAEIDSTTAVETTSHQDYIHHIYEQHLASDQADKYYAPLPEGDLYTGNKYFGNKTVNYFDLDGDGDDECVLSVAFESDEALTYQVVYVLDTDGQAVKAVFSSKDCGEHRAQQKFAIIREGNAYLIHTYYGDGSYLTGSIYRYNGKGTEPIWSYDCYVYDKVPESEHYYHVSQTHDFCAASEDSDGISDVSREEFYKKFNSYVENRCFGVPNHPEV